MILSAALVPLSYRDGECLAAAEPWHTLKSVFGHDLAVYASEVHEFITAGYLGLCLVSFEVLRRLRRRVMLAILQAHSCSLATALIHIPQTPANSFYISSCRKLVA